MKLTNPELFRLIPKLKIFKENQKLFRCNCPNCLSEDFKILGFEIDKDFRKSKEFQKLQNDYEQIKIQQMKELKNIIKNNVPILESEKIDN